MWAILERRKSEPAVFNAAIASAVTRTLVKPPPTDPVWWGLHELIEVAVDLHLVVKATADQVRLAKDFRNLIHPGRSQRVGANCNAGTAHAARAALEFVSNDLADTM